MLKQHFFLFTKSVITLFLYIAMPLILFFTLFDNVKTLFQYNTNDEPIFIIASCFFLFIALLLNLIGFVFFQTPLDIKISNNLYIDENEKIIDLKYMKHILHFFKIEIEPMKFDKNSSDHLIVKLYDKKGKEIKSKVILNNFNSKRVSYHQNPNINISAANFFHNFFISKISISSKSSNLVNISLNN